MQPSVVYALKAAADSECGEKSAPIARGRNLFPPPPPFWRAPLHRVQLVSLIGSLRASQLLKIH